MSLWDEERPFSTAEVATACHCSQRFVQKAIDAGALDACRLGRVWRVPASAARRFALEAGAEPPSDANVAHHANDANLVRQVVAESTMTPARCHRERESRGPERSHHHPAPGGREGVVGEARRGSSDA